jgi:parallel beta-helix repeat protein
VTGNTIEGFTNGILVQNASGNIINHNKVHTSGTGIGITGSSLDASSNKVLGNTIEASSAGFVGIIVVTGGSATANLNQIKSNTITDPTNANVGTTGIALRNLGGSLNGTLVRSNKLINMDTPFELSGDTGTVGKGNKCSPSSPCFP